MKISEKQNIQVLPIDDISNLGTEPMKKVLISEGSLIYVAEFTGPNVRTWVVCDDDFREQLTEATIKPKIEIEGKVSKVEDIGISAFKDCVNLRKIEIPEGILKIYAGAFSNCVSLEEVYLPDSLKYMGFGVFSGCRNLKKISLPSTCEINGNPFIDCHCNLVIERR